MTPANDQPYYRVDLAPADCPPGTIEIFWRGCFTECSMVLSGNDADDFLEKLRACPDEETRDLVFIHAIGGTETP
jgi:hypothetical protein